LQLSQNFSQQKNAAERITAVFLELQGKQLPIESTERPLELKTAKDITGNLFIHPNYLHSAIKEITASQLPGISLRELSVVPAKTEEGYRPSAITCF
jgi:hypothetical protein